MEYSESFQKAIKPILAIEGGLSDRKNDRGGLTKYGISQRQYPHLDIRNLTIKEAIEIYHRDFWLHYRCDELPPHVAVFIFDCQVNHRPKVGPRFLQSAIGAVADGIIGSKTIQAAHEATNKPHRRDEVLGLLFAYRADFYHDITLADIDQEENLLGWFKRLFKLQQFIEREIIRETMQ